MAFAWHNLKLNRNNTGWFFQLFFGVFDIGFNTGCQAVLGCAVYQQQKWFQNPRSRPKTRRRYDLKAERTR
jgi:hypothetical protein